MSPATYDPVPIGNDPPPSYDGDQADDNDLLTQSHPLIHRLNTLRSIYLIVLCILITTGLSAVIVSTFFIVTSKWLSQTDKMGLMLFLIVGTIVALFCIPLSIRPLYNICQLRKRVARKARDEGTMGDNEGWRKLEDEVDKMVRKGWCCPM